MSQSTSSEHLESVSDRFDACWQAWDEQSPPPAIEQFLPAAPEGEARRELLEELIERDMEQRWKRWGHDGDGQRLLRLEDYRNRFAELARGPMPAEMIAEEYRVRQRWGDRPGAESYLARFPNHPENLGRLLARVDAELNREYPNRTGPFAGSDPAETSGLPENGTSQAPAFSQQGGYERQSILGHGGMGIVYKARDVRLDRTVALKVILTGRLAAPEYRARFLVEAQAQARLQHPNIVQVFEVGEDADGPYVAMEYVSGGSLSRQIGGTPQDVRDSARLVATLARAMQYAHERGVIHRDLKPGNILLQATNHETHERHEKKNQESRTAQDGPSSSGSGVSCLSGFVPKIADFGLAKRLDDETDRTQSGAIVGTPSYMAPEQAAGRSRDVTAATDVYALGAILYELLTGRPPFKAATTHETTQQVLHADPVVPSTLRPGAPRDIDTICLKCLRKDPNRRYPSAGLLADDLERFLDGRPILARPVGTAERLLKWARRRPALAGMTVLGILATVAIMSILLASRQLLIEEVQRTAYQRKQADEAQKREAKEAETARKEKANADDARALAEQKVVRLHLENGQRMLAEGDLSASLPWLVEALRLDSKDPTRAIAHQTRLASVLRQCPRPSQLWFHDGVVSHVEFSRDGRRLVSASYDETARIWDTITGEVVGQPLRCSGVVTWAGFSLDNRTVLTVSGDHRARAWDVASGQQLYKEPIKLTGPGNHGGFSADGTLAFAASGQKHGTTRTTRTPIAQPDMMIPNGRGGFNRVPRAPLMQENTTNERGSVRIWDLATGQTVPAKPVSVQGWLEHAALSPDGSLVAAGGGTITQSGQARIWNAQTGEAVIDRLPHRTPVHWVSFSPDGRRMATACGSEAGGPGVAQVWDAVTGAPVGPPLEHRRAVMRVLFSPAGGRLLTVSHDHTACLWNAETGGLVVTLARHHGGLGCAAFSPDGRRIVTAGQDRTARLWDAVTGEPLLTPLWHDSAVNSVAFSPDGRFLATGCRSGTVQIWDLEVETEQSVPLDHGTPVRGAVLSPDGATAITATGGQGTVITVFARGLAQVEPFNGGGKVHLWDAMTGKALLRDVPLQVPLTASSISPDGRRVVLATRETDAGGKARWQATVRELATGKAGNPFRPAGEIAAAGFDLAGEALVVTTQAVEKGTSQVQVWNAETGKELGRPIRTDQPVRRVVAGPGFRFLVTIAHEGPKGQVCHLRIWRTDTGEPAGPQIDLAEDLELLALSPDGSRLATTSPQRPFAPRQDVDVRLWEVASGKAATSTPQHHDRIHYLEFSSDGLLLVTASADRTARVWNAVTGQPLTRPLEHPGGVITARFSADGRRVATAGAERTARVWDTVTGDSLTPALRHGADVVSAAFLAGDNRLATVSQDGTLHRWGLAPLNADAGELRTLAELLARHELDETGGLVPLEPAASRARWERCRQRLVRLGLDR